MKINKGDKFPAEVIVTAEEMKEKSGWPMVILRCGNYVFHVVEECLPEPYEYTSRNSNDKLTLHNGMIVRSDGYIECPYQNNLECSIYLKRPCNQCTFNKEVQNG